MNRLIGALAMAAGLLLGTGAMACGDKLSVIGGGVRFERVYAARHPGRIALFVPQDSTLRSANEELRLADALARAGHTVLVIDDVADLPHRLQPDGVDLVLVDAADTRRLAASLAGAPTAVVLQVSKESASKAAASGGVPASCVMHLSRRTSLQLLRKVDDVFDRRARGLLPDCPAESAPAST